MVCLNLCLSQDTQPTPRGCGTHVVPCGCSTLHTCAALGWNTLSTVLFIRTKTSRRQLQLPPVPPLVRPRVPQALVCLGSSTTHPSHANTDFSRLFACSDQF